MSRPKLSEERRIASFWERTTRDGECVLWTGTRNQYGYGRFWDGRKLVCAHRWTYEQKFGPIPPGMHACHRCDTPACVNPDHIFIGTPKQNTDDAIAKGRWHHGKRLGRTRSDARISDESVVSIRFRAAAGERLVDLAAEFKASESLINHIVTGVARRSVGGPLRQRPRSKLGDFANKRALKNAQFKTALAIVEENKR